MKNPLKYPRSIPYCILTALLLMCAGKPVFSAGDPQRVAVVPFTINAEKDLSYLKSGIVDMLTSRLSWPGKVEVIGKEKVMAASASLGPGAISESGARKLGRQLGADYVLFGSLTVLGNSVSIDAKMLDSAGSGQPLTFFGQSDGMEGVISKIDTFAADINSQVFNRGTVARKAPAQAPAKAGEPSQEGYMHPEKLLKGGFSGFDDESTPFIMMGDSAATSRRFWKSQNYKLLFNGLALGDVDDDGKIETVIVTPNQVIIYRLEKDRFFKAAEIPKESGKNYIGVDVGDINDNGVSEIYVTSLTNARNMLNSVVFEYSDGAFKKIADNTRWYYRVVDIPNRGEILYGQRSKPGGPFGGKIYELTWNGVEYIENVRVPISRDVNLLGFSAGNIRNDGSLVYVAYDKYDKIQFFDESGTLLNTSADRYGGSTQYFLAPWDDKGQVENRRYFPMRLWAQDFTGNGQTEVIAAHNHELASRRLEQFRMFNKTNLVSLVWDGVSLAPDWRTRQTAGAIRDFGLGDFDNDGQDELVAALVLKEGAIVLTQPKSTVIAYELKFEKDEQEEAEPETQ